MNIVDLKNELTYTTHSEIAARTSTLTTTGLDITQYKGSLVIRQLVGTVSGTSPTLDGKIQHSTDNSAWSDYSGATYTQVTASNSSQTVSIDTRAAYKYIRYVGTIAGTSPSFTMGIQIVGQTVTS